MILTIKYPNIIFNTLFPRIPEALQDEYLGIRKA